MQSLVYMSASLLPSATASSVHVTKMCAAFAAVGIDTKLVGLGDVAATPEVVRTAYGEPDNFDIHLVRHRGLLDYRVRYAFGILSGGWVPREAMIYTRVPKIAALAARLRRPCVLELHHPPTRGNEGALRQHLGAGTGVRLVVITETLKDWAVQNLRIASEEVLVAHDGADPFPLAVKPELPPSGRCRVGYLGSLYPGKGIEIITALAPRLPELDFVVVGGMPNDLALWKSRTRGIGNLSFVGSVPHSKTLSWLRAFDIALLPNQRKVSTFTGGADIGRWTSPLKAFEYMSAGLPIIASDLENLREVFTDGETALLCPPDAPHAWEAALRRLNADAALHRRLGKRAAETFAARYTWVERARVILRGLERSQ